MRDASSVEDLIARAAGLKGELVAFAQSPQFARRLDALLFAAADRRGHAANRDER